MNRLTKKNENILTNDIEKYIINPFDQIKVNNKLGQLEDVEENNDCDLIILSKALKNGIYTIWGYISPEDLVIWEWQLHWKPMTQTFSKEIFLQSDYGKTWSLTREELE